MRKLNRISKKIRNRFNEITDISEELTMGLPKMSLLGNKECLIENCKGIIQYENEKIRLKTTIGEASVEGKSLHINEIGEGELLIKGQILNLRLEE